MSTPAPAFSGDTEKGLPLDAHAHASSPSPAPSSNYGYAGKKYDGLKGRAVRTMDFLVEHGVEERGIQPRPEDVSCARGDEAAVSSPTRSTPAGPLTAGTRAARLALVPPPADVLGRSQHQHPDRESLPLSRADASSPRACSAPPASASTSRRPSSSLSASTPSCASPPPGSRPTDPAPACARWCRRGTPWATSPP